MEAEKTQNPWMSSEQTATMEINGRDLSLMELAVSDREEVGCSTSQSHQTTSASPSEVKLGLGARAFSAAGAAVLSAIIVNPLDVVKVI